LAQEKCAVSFANMLSNMPIVLRQGIMNLSFEQKTAMQITFLQIAVLKMLVKLAVEEHGAENC
jgi:hypothetical protein